MTKTITVRHAHAQDAEEWSVSVPKGRTEILEQRSEPEAFVARFGLPDDAKQLTYDLEPGKGRKKEHVVLKTPGSQSVSVEFETEVETAGEAQTEPDESASKAADTAGAQQQDAADEQKATGVQQQDATEQQKAAVDQQSSYTQRAAASAPTLGAEVRPLLDQLDVMRRELRAKEEQVKQLQAQAASSQASAPGAGGYGAPEYAQKYDRPAEDTRASGYEENPEYGAPLPTQRSATREATALRRTAARAAELIDTFGAAVANARDYFGDALNVDLSGRGPGLSGPQLAVAHLRVILTMAEKSLDYYRDLAKGAPPPEYETAETIGEAVKADAETYAGLIRAIADTPEATAGEAQSQAYTVLLTELDSGVAGSTLVDLSHFGDPTTQSGSARTWSAL
jgi:hypothetical protein